MMTDSTSTIETSLPPDRFELKNFFWVSSKVRIYNVYDHHFRCEARLWLEEITQPLAVYAQRAESLKDLSHANIFSVIEHWRTSDDKYYAVLTQAPNANFVNLQTLMVGMVDLVATREIIEQLALALHYCHYNGLPHLHLQPTFVWLSLDGTVHLELFAALPLPTGASSSFASSKLVRIAPYRSPEQFMPKTKQDARCDVYALGLIAYEMLIGSNPFLATSDALCQLLHTHKAIIPLVEINLATNLRLSNAIGSTLVKNPSGRCPSVLDFMLEFEASLAEMKTLPTQTNIKGLLERQIQLAQEAINFPQRQASIIDSIKLIPQAPKIATVTSVPQAEAVGGVSIWFVILTFLLTLAAGYLIVDYITKPEIGMTQPIIPEPIAVQPSVTPTQQNRLVESLAAADRLLFENGDFDKAIEIYQLTIAREPNYAPTYRKLGRALYLWGHDLQETNAVEILKKGIALEPTDALGWAFLAFAYHDVQNYAKGLEAADQALKLNVNLPEGHAARALLLLNLDKLDLANEVISEAVRLDPNSFWVQLVWSAVLTQNKDWLRALEINDKVLNMYPRIALLPTLKADILRITKTSDAKLWYQQALKLDAGFPYAHSGLGWLAFNEGLYSQAETAFDKALAAKPKHVRSLTGLGYAKLGQHEYSEAILVFNRAIEADIREAEAYNGLAAAYLNQSKYASAVTWADLAIKYAPRYSDAYYNKGRAFYELKDYKAAITAFEAATNLIPTSPQYHEALAYAYYGSANIAAAKLEAEESLRLKADNVGLNDLLKLLK